MKILKQCYGTKFRSEYEAKVNCPSYCIVRYCEECKSWHVVQEEEAKEETQSAP